ncbi:MAG: LEA type 2 family protein [Candidatus Marinimicrobia bacterium]|nr:LEA type 2 family protein [Candidatus Neomarinimicrobiota bacterium]
MKRSIPILIAILLVNLSPLSAQFDKLKKQALKVIKEQVKPLELDFKVQDVKYNPFKGPNKLVLGILFDGNNPNKIGIGLNRVEFDLYIDDEFATKFYNDKKITIPKNGDFSFEETAEIKISTVGKAIFNSIIKKKSVYRIEGTYFLDTKLGTFSFKATLAEKVVNE